MISRIKSLLLGDEVLIASIAQCPLSQRFLREKKKLVLKRTLKGLNTGHGWFSQVWGLSANSVYHQHGNYNDEPINQLMDWGTLFSDKVKYECLCL